jgi:5'-phosphate synthase pdxT subunit
MAALNIGVLALQGDFHAHMLMLGTLQDVHAREVRTAADLTEVDGLVLPGGESTTIIKLLQRSGLDKAIITRAEAHMPIYGTCAGLILLAARVSERPDQPTLNLMDITVARNAFGRQIDSFETDLVVTSTDADIPVRGVFIRAPFVEEHGNSVEVLSTYRDRVVAVKQGNLIHRYFADMVQRSIKQSR